MVARDNQVNNSSYYQLRFSFEDEGIKYECFATAPKFLIPKLEHVQLQLLGVVDDVLCPPEDIDEQWLLIFKAKALEVWKNEVS